MNQIKEIKEVRSKLERLLRENLEELPALDKIDQILSKAIENLEKAKLKNMYRKEIDKLELLPEVYRKSILKGLGVSNFTKGKTIMDLEEEVTAVKESIVRILKDVQSYREMIKNIVKQEEESALRTLISLPSEDLLAIELLSNAGKKLTAKPDKDSRIKKEKRILDWHRKMRRGVDTGILTER